MSTSSSPESSAGPPLRVSELFSLLPDLAELGPFLDLLIMRSVADPDRRWTASGELGTVGDRVVDAAGLEAASGELAAAEARRVERLITRTAVVVGALAAGNWERSVQLLLEQGEKEEQGGRVAGAEAWYMAAHGLARERGLELAPRALRLAARAARATGRLDTAASRYEEAWRSATDLGLEDDLIVAAIGRGNVDVDRGRWEVARKWYDRALEVVGERGAPRRERWQVHQNLSIVHRQNRRLEEARRSLERAEAEGRRLEDPDMEVEVGNGWGKLRFAEGDPRAAQLHFERALEKARRPVAKVAIGVNLGESLLAQGRTLEAAEQARRAEAAALAGGVAAKLPEIYRLLAAVAHERGETEAFVFLERALELIRNREMPAYEEALTREAYGRLRVEQGDEERGRVELRRAERLFAELGADRAGAVGTDAGEAMGGTGPAGSEGGEET